MSVSTHSRPKAAAPGSATSRRRRLFQHTAARRRLQTVAKAKTAMKRVSTHSRPKAAAFSRLRRDLATSCFNTQPPEGGCQAGQSSITHLHTFQHTAARRRLPEADRRTAASAGFNTQPPEGGCPADRAFAASGNVSTHSRPKAAANAKYKSASTTKFQHTAARRRLRSDCNGLSAY